MDFVIVKRARLTDLGCVMAEPKSPAASPVYPEYASGTQAAGLSWQSVAYHAIFLACF